VYIFTEFSPEAVEHEFGSGFTSWSFDDECWIEVNVFFLLVVSDVIRFFFGGVDAAGVPCRFLFYFEPGVDVLRKESRFSLVQGEMPDFMDSFGAVSHFNGFDEFWGAPGPAQLLLFGSMGTMVRFFQKAFWHFFFEGNGEFTAMSVR